MNIPPPSPNAWKGPKEHGVSISSMESFLQCPFRFYIQKILCLEDDLPPHDNLVFGDSGHVGLEWLIRGETLLASQRAALKHLKENYPECPLLNSYRGSLPALLSLYDLSILPPGEWETEVPFSHTVDGFKINGIVDGVGPDCIVEHKFKKQIAVDPILLSEEIHVDTQCNVYMKLFKVETVYYDLIGIPETAYKFSKPYKSKVADDRDYGESLVYGGEYNPGDLFPVDRNVYRWISQRPYTINFEDQELFWNRTFLPNLKRMQIWYEYVTDPSFDPNNPECYNEIFYINPVRSFQQSNTEKFKCNYHAVLTGHEDFTSLREKKNVSIIEKEI